MLTVKMQVTHTYKSKVIPSYPSNNVHTDISRLLSIKNLLFYSNIYFKLNTQLRNENLKLTNYFKLL